MLKILVVDGFRTARTFPIRLRLNLSTAVRARCSLEDKVHAMASSDEDTFDLPVLESPMTGRIQHHTRNLMH
jgi:hypothetical protein